MVEGNFAFFPARPGKPDEGLPQGASHDGSQMMIFLIANRPSCM
jgi:hypothetical protein